MNGREFFTAKTIECHITLAEGSFSEGSTKIVAGLATEIRVEKPGLPDKNKATVTIRGMLDADMDMLAMLAPSPKEARNNRIAVLAGDAAGLSQVFSGEITDASANYNAAPDIPFTITALSGYYSSLMPTPSTSYKGDVPVADIVASLAAEAGYAFRAENVSAKLLNAVLTGPPLEKARAAAAQAGVTLLVDDGTFILLSEDQAREGDPVRISKETGMVGYPSYSAKGISVKTYYNPALVHKGLIEVDSVVKKARGVWRIVKLCHSLSAHMPGGSWQSEIEAEPVK